MRKGFRIGLYAVCAAAIAAFAATTPPAGSVVESHESSASSSYIGSSSGYQVRQGQQFYVDEEDAQPISGIGILLRSTDHGQPQGDITLALYDNAGGNVPGSKIAGTEKSFTPVLGQWNYVSFDQEITLGAGSDNKYWIVASAPDQAGENDAYCWHRSSSNTYGRGYRKTYNKDGANLWSSSQTGDFAFRIYGDASLAVLLSQAEARRVQGGVEVSWTTESEVGVAGFNVLRAESEDGPFYRLNTALIRSKGSSSGRRHYSYTDRAARGSTVYWYRIQEQQDRGRVRDLCTLKSEPDLCVRPETTEIVCACPNPFNPRVNIFCTLGREHTLSGLKVRIYNVMGRNVRSLKIPHAAPDTRVHVTWDGKNETGREVASGVYVCSLVSGGAVLSSAKLFKVQ